MSILNGLKAWHNYVKTGKIEALDNFLDDEVVFYTPVLFKPIEGKFMVLICLNAASKIIVNDKFSYIRNVCDKENAMLEFVTEIDKVIVEGIDMISFTKDGKLKEIKIMLRSLKAANLIKQKIGKYLEKMKVNLN